MDKLQKDILNILLENSRRSDDDIASMIVVSMVEVETAIKKMVEDGVIRRFSTVVNENFIEGFPIKALVELSIRPEKNTGYDSIANKIIGFSKVVSHYLVSGQYDFLLVVEGKDHKDIAHFVFDKLATINNVKSTTTHFIFKTYKEQGALMEDSSQGERIPILP